MTFTSSASNLVAGDTIGVSDVFVRASPSPEVGTFSPPTAVRAAAQVPFTVSGRGFLPGARVDARPGTTVHVLSVSPTEIAGTLDVAAGVALGPRTISVTNLSGPGFAVGLCPDCLAVTQP